MIDRIFALAMFAICLAALIVELIRERLRQRNLTVAHCIECGKPIKSTEIAFGDRAGDWVCAKCKYSK